MTKSLDALKDDPLDLAIELGKISRLKKHAGRNDWHVFGDHMDEIVDALQKLADEPEPEYHLVKSGDTLWAIAEQHYGKGQGDKSDLIFKANSPPLTDPNMIHPGQKLRIPALS